MISFQNLYIHVPFCRKKCGYCAFYSLPDAPRTDMEAWMKEIVSRLELHTESLQHLHTLYFGGGTPSLLPPDLLGRLLEAVSRFTSFDSVPEITMEANPGTVTPELCKAVSSRINRVSMGVQSFSPDLLTAAGRMPVPDGTVERALEHWHNAGIDNCGIDLIFGLPGQDMTAWENDLKRAVSLGIRHISAYSLMLESGTPLERSGVEPDEDLSAEMWEYAGQFLAASGFPRYEISNYAAEPFPAQHNMNIWHGETYLGLGPAAASFDGTDRWMEPSDLARWLRHEPAERDVISRDRRLREIFLMGLRTVRGWRCGEFEQATGALPDFPELENLKKKDLIESGPYGIRPSAKGLAFWNEIALELL